MAFDPANPSWISSSKFMDKPAPGKQEMAEYMLEQQFGPDWMKLSGEGKIYQTPDGAYHLLDERVFKNPANPRGTPLWLQPRHQTGTDLQGNMTWESDPVETVSGWDESLYGKMADWNPTDILPGLGISAQKHKEQLEKNPIFKQAMGTATPGGGGFGDIMSFLGDALKSPGIGIPLGAAALGTAFGPGGFLSGPASGAGGLASGLTEGATLASELGFVPGSFELGVGGLGGLDAATAEFLASAGGGLSSLPSNYWNMLAGDAPSGGIGGLGESGGFDLNDFFSSWESQAGNAGTTGGGGFNFADLPNIPTSVPGGGGGGGGLPSVNPNSVMGVDYGTAGEGTGLLQGPATGAGGPSLLQQLQLAQIAGQIPGGMSALQKILNGTATASDYASIAGTALSTALGMYNSSNQTNALKDLSAQYLQLGQPSRQRYEASYKPGFTMMNEPGYADALNSTSDALLRKLSATSGNPYGSPGGLIEATKAVNASLALPALQNYRNQNAATGGYSAFNTAAPGVAGAAINSQGGALTNLAGGISDILNPRPQSLTLADLLRLGGNLSGGGFSLT